MLPPFIKKDDPPTGGKKGEESSSGTQGVGVGKGERSFKKHRS